ncbi:BTB/POZ domain-containing protein 1 [Fulvia fulva]|uniref:BTB/POZ domain-containing protein 1 n=1 Tax=Passalora fulva TaxID=5499 RepID=A0A9Q8P3M1_PASFU|nr:BTB/POZ domain-containing protein 1 [Fulvia fulva]KAK4635675.1 BTB/POZ domain-containing protein 1 [Fulvia fulva]KAK4637464.1 BTB/POZ domain-containing protein 1 [Fulvia fulva]UJO11837.1 BTB/POZ domain-containing protein 1 [Fulvia fulva]WPV08129.1 BTB/POZ domain-containing protein 1 [Fulvia fulva]WPV25004.1 BTB/POZ domain-containing protein 1 [Fulvia fulva]
MISLLWKAFYDDHVDTFRQLLETAAYNARPYGARGASSHRSAAIASPVQPGTSPMNTRSRRTATPKTAVNAGSALTKENLNMLDGAGMTLLHYAVSSVKETAIDFATALLEHPIIDLYAQDEENGWTALHRAFYFGNITIARFILERDAGVALSKLRGNSRPTLSLVKVKDKEGLGPLDLYAATIKDRTLRPALSTRQRSGSNGSDDERPILDPSDGHGPSPVKIPFIDVHGDQLFHFGSNRNVSLGFGDQDDRQFPERINLRRPEHLVRRFYEEYLDHHESRWSGHDPAYQSKADSVSNMWVEDIPWMPKSRPLEIQDVHMSKLHTAVLTTDPEANLYMCGHGQGGRLGTGDERTRFHFVCIEGGALAGKRVATVALGQNHTLALSDDGEIFSWGNNAYGQLGYNLPKAPNDEEPITTIPQQIFGPLKRETVIGVAASRVHSVAHTATSLYVMGKNDGQLGIVDSDARSLDMQVAPRRVAAALFTSAIASVAAIDSATVCLLDNHDVWVFANFGYAKVPFPLDGFTNYFLRQSFLVTTYDSAPNQISKVTAEGDTICALSTRGEVYTVSISQRQDTKASVSTTNPTKIRGAISTPQRIWSPKKSSMAARDVGLDTDGSIILSTEEGSVWNRTKRATMKDASNVATSEYKPKDYKFSRVPGLTRVMAVRSSGHGAYAAIRRDCDVLQTQVVVEDPTLWKDLFPLLSLSQLIDHNIESEDDTSRHRFWQGTKRPSEVLLLRKAVLRCADIGADLKTLFENGWNRPATKYDALLATTSSEVRIPVHRWLLTARSRVLRRGFSNLCEMSTFTIPDFARSELDDEGRVVITFQGLDLLTILDLALYIYTDTVVDFWHFVKSAPKMAYSYRQVRTELMKVATRLELAKLEPAVRQMVEPRPCLDMDMEIAHGDPAYFYDGDVVIELEDDEVKVHSTLMRTRCPFFEGMFMGRSRGGWLAGRDDHAEVNVDLKHINSKTFSLVLRHIYCDSGEELFDEIVSVDIDDFLDSVLDVLSAANELMLDRLQQIAQAVIGRFVNVRNVCDLLNAIAPSSVREFKDAGLEYLCLNLEAMLQGQYLGSLDEDLLLELDKVVRGNQLAYMPFAKSGRAARELLDQHPELAATMDRNKRAKVDNIALKAKYDRFVSFAPGSLDEDNAASPMQLKTRRRSSNTVRTSTDHPSLRAKASTKDMMFAMDEEVDSGIASPQASPSIRPMPSPRGLDPQSTPPDDVWFNSRGKALPSPKLAAQSVQDGFITPRTPISPLMAGKTPPNAGRPWTLTPLPGQKMEMKDIMAQTISGRKSSITQGLAAAKGSEDPMDVPAPFRLPGPKMSQKDRKRMQQVHQASLRASPAPEEAEVKSFSWQAVSNQKRPGLKDVIECESTSKGSPSRSPSTPTLTTRQTVANPKASSSSKPAIGPASPSLRQLSVTEHKTMATNGAEGKGQANSVSHVSNSKPIPQSVRHQPVVDPAWGLSMSEIVAQQELEKNAIKEAAAKRDLQEIQAEQEFQEWWEKESARVQEAEQQATAAATKAPKRNRGRRGHAGRGGKGTGGKGREHAANGGEISTATSSATKPTR